MRSRTGNKNEVIKQLKRERSLTSEQLKRTAVPKEDLISQTSGSIKPKSLVRWLLLLRGLKQHDLSIIEGMCFRELKEAKKFHLAIIRVPNIANLVGRLLNVRIREEVSRLWMVVYYVSGSTPWSLYADRLFLTRKDATQYCLGMETGDVEVVEVRNVRALLHTLLQEFI